MSIVRRQKAFIIRDAKTKRWTHQNPYVTTGGVRSAVEWFRDNSNRLPGELDSIDALEVCEIETVSTVVDVCSARALLRAPDHRPNKNANGNSAGTYPLSELVPERYRPDPPPPPPKPKLVEKPAVDPLVSRSISLIEVD